MLNEEVQNIFLEKGLTLSVAESCTGGAIAARLTKVPDSSKYFLGGIIAYSNSLKENVLNVPSILLETVGAVSPEVARAMLQGVLEITGSDYGIAVTGIAGPKGATPKKPVGTVWVAIGKRAEEPKVWNVKASGSREHIIEQTVEESLGELITLIK